MKKLALLASSATLAAAVSLPTQAEVSANAGFVSDYYFRGANLGDGGVYGGLDYEQGGFFAGTWWIDDGTGYIYTLNEGQRVEYELVSERNGKQAADNVRLVD